MPYLDLIPKALYEPMQPYYVDFDNMPLKNIMLRISLVNSAVDTNTAVLRESIGNTGSLANRLAESLDDDGSLLVEAVDATLHNIGSHEDGQGLNDSDVLTDYVRMELVERAKLDDIAIGATSLKLMFIETETISGTTSDILFDSNTLEIIPSSTITWKVTGEEGHQQVQAHMSFPPEIAHQHYYDMTPVNDDLGSPDYQTFKVTSLATPYLDGTLKVYVNGMRLSETMEIYVPRAGGPEDPWQYLSFTPDASSGKFQLSQAVAASDTIRVDFDTAIY